ncbi:hypothetical protein GQ607_011367 [Colletotrichum asianum]|uniref:Uncharacterized protein n=1 Tax=Colletotrichum asianum TaxID=702518 RepID=A0A8H3W6C5_9PEZI|nr:hypothetical protein GQ607_011367 [Colletotrichum asianum]
MVFCQLSPRMGPVRQGKGRAHRCKWTTSGVDPQIPTVEGPPFLRPSPGQGRCRSRCRSRCSVVFGAARWRRLSGCKCQVSVCESVSLLVVTGGGGAADYQGKAKQAATCKVSVRAHRIHSSNSVLASQVHLLPPVSPPPPPNHHIHQSTVSPNPHRRPSTIPNHSKVIPAGPDFPGTFCSTRSLAPFPPRQTGDRRLPGTSPVSSSSTQLSTVPNISQSPVSQAYHLNRNPLSHRSTYRFSSLTPAPREIPYSYLARPLYDFRFFPTHTPLRTWSLLPSPPLSAAPAAGGSCSSLSSSKSRNRCPPSRSLAKVPLDDSKLTAFPPPAPPS